MFKFKKLRKGMTLVEIIVAMSIFSIGSVAVTMAFAAAVKYNSHNQTRDEELAIQQSALQTGLANGLEVYNGYYQNRKIDYTVRPGTSTKYGTSAHTYDKFIDAVTAAEVNPFANASEYKASKSGKNDEKFEFELKTFSTTPLGSSAVIYEPLNDEYKISFSNLWSENIDVRLETDGGTIFLGSSSDGYRHSSNVYWRSVAKSGTATIAATDSTPGGTIMYAPSGFEIGYKLVGMGTTYPAPIRFTFYKNGAAYRTYTLNGAALKASPSGHLKLKMGADGEVGAQYM